jgi:hypothetical protein
MSGLNLLDRMLVWHARTAVKLLNRRLSIEHSRVWWWQSHTLRPQPGQVWDDETFVAEVRIGFGGSEREALGRGLVLGTTYTRPMFDMLVDGAVEARRMQDVQLAALRARAVKGPFGIVDGRKWPSD